MSAAVFFVLLLGGFLAYVNGSNDVSKSIATLAGSGVTNYRRAILWGTFWTGAGGLAGAAFAGAMVTTFGKGLLASGVTPTFAAAAATVLGATAWVAIATRTGLPVSTTHAIVGSISGVGLVAYGLAGVRWGALGGKIALPLLLSPLIALAATQAVLRSWNFLSQDGGTEVDCLCAEFATAPTLVGAGSDNTAVITASFAPGLEVTVGPQRQCAIHHSAAVQVTTNHLHWATSGATSFARGMNDAPKIVALVLAAASLMGPAANIGTLSFFVVTLGMVAGSWLAGQRVTTVMAEKITSMDHREGFVANLITAVLVGSGATMGLPMSTTHVSSGAIIAVGVRNRAGLNWRTVRTLLSAWVVTLPAAALLGILAYGFLRLGRLG